MIITNSSIGMDSARTYTSVSRDAFTYQKSVTTMSVKDFVEAMNSAYQDVHNNKSEKIEDKEKDNSDKDADTLSDNSESSLDYLKGKFGEISTSKVAKTTKAEEDLRSAIRYMLLNFLLMLLMGGKGEESRDLLSEAFSSNAMTSGNLLGGGVSFTAVSETLTVEHYKGEFEGTTFNAKGIVNTADGRQLDFGIDITMSRSFEKFVRETDTCESFEMRLCDPLVINLENCAADISDQKFYFDLDCDGRDDEISKLGAGSGFLALDLNEDGEINDGSELFGTKSGDGFRDLSKYDKDGDGWIDEADEVFDKLRIMCFNEDGTTTLYKLKDKDVGAIYLGNKDTQFSVTDQENKVNAMVRKTGLFLYESGMAGTIQHVDLALEKGDNKEMCFSA